MGTYLTVALRNLLQAKRRTALLSTALALVSMLLVMLLALSQGVSDTLTKNATTLMSGHVNIGGFYKFKTTDANPMITRVGEIREVVKKTLPDVALLIDRNRGWGKIVSETGAQQVGMAGVDIAEEANLAKQIQLARPSTYKNVDTKKKSDDEAKADGKPTPPPAPVDPATDVPKGSMNDLSQPDTVVIFAKQASRLGVDVGDTVTLSTETINGQVNTTDVRVVAVAQDVGFMSGWQIYVPKQVIRKLYQLNDDTSGAVMVYLNDISRADQAMGELRKALTDAGFQVMEHQPVPFWQKFEVVGGEDWVGQKLDLTLWEDEVSYMKWVLGALDSLSFFLVAILLLIIVVGIMNTMWIAVRERTNEIGTLRAIGMQRGQVLILFMLEALLLGAAATSLGGFLGAVAGWSVNAAAIPVSVDAVRAILMSDTLQLSVRGAQIVSAVAVFTAFTMLAALWPSLRAARLQPVTAIHRVG